MPEPFELESAGIGGLPIVNHFLERIGFADTLTRYLPADDARLRLAPATAIGVAVRNLCVGREPLYGFGDWAATLEPALLGLPPAGRASLNDDRVGRSLLRLFDADRGSMLTELMLRVMRVFAIETRQFHNDSTSITVNGTYAAADGRQRAGQCTARITFGHSKDHRPGLRQLVWILTVSADGAVPIAYRVADGNTVDDPTHVETWDGLVALVGRADFLYVADCKLANRTAMTHIASRGGRFVTVLPRARTEDKGFRTWVQTHRPDWTEAARQPGARLGDPDRVWSTVPAPLPSAEGYRLVWVHSTDKQERDAAARAARIDAGVAALEALAERLRRPKSRLRTRVTVEAAAQAALTTADATRWPRPTVGETQAERFHQERRGRPGAQTRYRRQVRPEFTLRWEVALDQVAYDAASDGMFPLLTNDRDLSDAAVLEAYRYQPKLEQRHAQLKGVHLMAPVLLKDVARIEGLLFCYFIALLVHALIERELRAAMRARQLTELPLYHEGRPSRAPTAAQALDAFAPLTRHRLLRNGRVIQTFEPKPTPLQAQLLDLLQVPPRAYAAAPPNRGAFCPPEKCKKRALTHHWRRNRRTPAGQPSRHYELPVVWLPRSWFLRQRGSEHVRRM